MNWKWLRVCCLAGLLAVVLALAGRSLSLAAGAQNGAASKSPAAPTAQQPATPSAPQVTAPVSQQPAAPAAPAKDSTDQTEAPDMFRIISNAYRVSTPVTVHDSGGNLVYDLEKDEFKIYDNGQLQDITDFDTEMRRVSLVIVVETNDTTAAYLDSVRDLGSMFSDMVMGPKGEVAVLTFSDHVDMPLDFTENGDKLDTALRGLHGRGSGMHLDDALVRAISKLDYRPKEDKKVVISFSDGFNIGSKMTSSEIVKRAMNSDITLYGLGFSPIKGLIKRPAEDPKPDLVDESVARNPTPNSVPTPTAMDNTWEPNDIPIISILLGMAEEAKKPLFKNSLITFANYSGGKYYQKWGKGTVQEALNEIATEIHAQYELAYSPPKPIEIGFHKIQVQVRRPGAKVRSRAGWFYQGADVPRGVPVK
jgi:VWFA-related protein